MTDLLEAMKASNKQGVYQYVINNARYHARNHASNVCEANPHLTTVGFHPLLQAAVAVLRKLDESGKPVVVAAYTMRACRRSDRVKDEAAYKPGTVNLWDYTGGNYGYDFTEITGDDFARIATEDFAVVVARAPRPRREWTTLVGPATELYPGEFRAMEEVTDELDRGQEACGSFEMALNDANIALMTEGLRPFLDWREFWAAAVRDAAASGYSFAEEVGVSDQEFNVLTGINNPEIDALRARLGYEQRDAGD